MEQLSKAKATWYHFYPGILITISFIAITPIAYRNHYPPQLGLLISILLVAIPVMVVHLRWVRKREKVPGILALNGYINRLPTAKLILYAVGLVILSFLIWGVTQPFNQFVADRLLGWLPKWDTVQDFQGYEKGAIRLTLFVNLFLNGLLAPFVEELYFRGYLLSRMERFGKKAFAVNAVLFSLYHLWQPAIYLTLILSMLPMIYLVWKTKDLRLGILTHCLLNLIGAVFSFGLLLPH